MADTMENTLQDTEEKHELDDTNMSLLLNDSQDSQTNRKRHNHYDVTTKLEAIQWARTISINSASRQYGVDRKCVKRWMVQEDELHNLLNTPSGSKRKRLYGGGRSVLHPDLDEELASWVREMKQNKESISRRIISNKAMQLFSNTEVKISNGWLSSFMKRHNFMQQRDTAPRLIPQPESYAESVANFFVGVEEGRTTALPAITGSLEDDLNACLKTDEPIGTTGLQILSNIRSHIMTREENNELSEETSYDDLNIKKELESLEDDLLFG